MKKEVDGDIFLVALHVFGYLPNEKIRKWRNK